MSKNEPRNRAGRTQREQIAADAFDDGLGDYADALEEIAARVRQQDCGSRDRSIIRDACEAWIMEEDPDDEVPQNRWQLVARGLSIGVTKLLEAWEWVELNKAWPLED